MNLPANNKPDNKPDIKTVKTAAILSTEWGDLEVDFVTGVDYRRPKRAGGGELIAKAMGYKQGIREVLDLTAGLCMDSVLLAQIGFKVVAVERNQEIFRTLQQAWELAKSQCSSAPIEGPGVKDWIDNLTLVYGDSGDLMASLVDPQKQQSIYLDPMFPKSNKTALPRKGMQIFRNLLNHENEGASEKLLDLALTSGASRVVVKRPLNQPPLRPRVRHRFMGKTVRYDLYLK